MIRILILKKNNKSYYSFFPSLTIDVISSCCFGVQTDAFNDPDSDFIKILKKAFTVSLSPKMALICKLNKHI